MKRKTKKRLKWVLMSLVLILLLLVVLFLALKVLGENAMLGRKDEAVEMTAPGQENIILEDEGETITYKGETYLYNENVTAVLCMGIDREDIEGNVSTIGQSGQADMLMLAILDTENGNVNLWNISRDSMTDVDIYNVDGD